MDAAKVSIVHDYSEQLEDDENIYLQETKKINEEYSKNVYDQIVEEIYQLKSVNIPKNDPRLKQKIIEEINKIINQYGYIINTNRANQDNQLMNIIDGMSIDELQSIKFENIDMEESIQMIKSKIIDRIITYFNFENHGNSMYWEKSSQVEEIVKKEIKIEEIKDIAKKIEEIYVKVMEMMKQQQQQFIQDFSDEKSSDENNKVLQY